MIAVGSFVKASTDDAYNGKFGVVKEHWPYTDGFDAEYDVLLEGAAEVRVFGESELTVVPPFGTVQVNERGALVVDGSLKPTNPKDAIGSDKLPVHLWPATATAMGCLGLFDGALKYGRNNWRETGVRASIYVDALERHVRAWFEGEDLDPDSGAPHLAHALACLAIIVDAEAAGKLNDDRNYPGGYRPLVGDLTEFVPRMKEHHAAKSPKHWTIADA